MLESHSQLAEPCVVFQGRSRASREPVRLRLCLVGVAMADLVGVKPQEKPCQGWEWGVGVRAWETGQVPLARAPILQLLGQDLQVAAVTSQVRTTKWASLGAGRVAPQKQMEALGGQRGLGG